MASNPKHTLHQAIQAKFGLQNTSVSSKLSSTSTNSNSPQTMPRFVIPQLKITQLQLQASTNTDVVAQQASRVDQLQIGDDAGDGATTPLIDLSSTVIAGNKDAPPKESASKTRQLTTTSRQNFGDDELADQTPANTEFREQPGPIGHMLDAVVGYPEPRTPRLEYAVTRLERQHLRMCQREDYGSQVKRFRFETPSPDELIKNIHAGKEWKEHSSSIQDKLIEQTQKKGGKTREHHYHSTTPRERGASGRVEETRNQENSP
ncbi:hypothetical protein M5D96_012047 [Drosophila gunungcola]|uniref:Uncharacterized protein n=1 Tax=Drosophila gunungcola TaxID=103775 RepID=A0A9P9YE58_9MUSC|nr:hypothetical protein M5D96_012047 [Drosophila gunungcola]